MSDQNGWPDPQRPGVPENPERHGAHRLRHIESGLENDALWLCGGEWLDPDGDFGISHAAAFYSYLGPCLTPQEVAAREAAAKREGMEAARDMIAHRPDAYYELDARIRDAAQEIKP